MKRTDRITNREHRLGSGVPRPRRRTRYDGVWLAAVESTERMVAEKAPAPLDLQVCCDRFAVILRFPTASVLMELWPVKNADFKKVMPPRNPACCEFRSGTVLLHHLLLEAVKNILRQSQIQEID